MEHIEKRGKPHEGRRRLTKLKTYMKIQGILELNIKYATGGKLEPRIFSHDTPFHIGQLENAVRTVLWTLTTHQFQT